MEGDKTRKREEEDKILRLSVAACHRQQSHLCPVAINQMGMALAVGVVLVTLG